MLRRIAVIIPGASICFVGSLSFAGSSPVYDKERGRTNSVTEIITVRWRGECCIKTVQALFFTGRGFIQHGAKPRLSGTLSDALPLAADGVLIPLPFIEPKF